MKHFYTSLCLALLILPYTIRPNKKADQEYIHDKVKQTERKKLFGLNQNAQKADETDADIANAENMTANVTNDTIAPQTMAEQGIIGQDRLEHIVRALLTILQEPLDKQKILDNINNVLVNIIHLAVYLSHQPNVIRKQFVENSRNRIAQLITKKAQSSATMSVEQATADFSKEEDREQQIVLANFAQIVQGFFNIVQDPEDKQKIAQNLTHMLGNMINIALQATKSEKLSENTNERAIITYINNINDNTKTKMIHMITRRTLHV